MKMWVTEDNRTWFQKLCTNILCQGPIPQHVGLILDGNRRFARKCGLKTIEGHREGSLTLDRMLRWGMDFGVQEVTAYVFSIENFKRSKEEIDGLMEMAEKKFTTLLENTETLMKNGICIQFIGDWSLIPRNLRKPMFTLMVMTRHNKKLKLNYAFAYTSRNEIARGVETLHRGVKSGDLLVDDIDEDLFHQSFDIVPSLPLDLIVRTSGESRLSDFLLWQSAESVLCFVDVLWPEISFWNVCAALFHYQINYYRINKPKFSDKNNVDAETRNRQSIFIEKMRSDKFQWLKNEINSMDNI